MFANEFIPRGVRFGPYEGKRVPKTDLNERDTSYMWEVSFTFKKYVNDYVFCDSFKIKPNDDDSYYIDGRSEDDSNWLRFVNCARTEEEQNLVAFQYHGNIYYRSFKHIYPGKELFVWYGVQYARDLGISVSLSSTGKSIS